MPKRKKKQAWKSAAVRRLLELAGNPPSVEDAVRIVSEQLMAGVAQAPTDLNALARCVGVNVIVADDTYFLDDPIHDDGLRFYRVDASFPIEQRMDLAREIARAFFASLKPRGFTRGVELERVVEMMAAEFVLPTAAFHEARVGKLTVSQVVEVARLFKVSLRVAARRFMELPFVAVLEASPEQIEWAYGGVRAGRIDMLESDFRVIVEHAVSSVYEQPTLFFSPKRPWFGSRCVEWTSLDFNKTLILVRLPRRDERAR